MPQGCLFQIENSLHLFVPHFGPSPFVLLIPFVNNG